MAEIRKKSVVAEIVADLQVEGYDTANKQVTDFTKNVTDSQKKVTEGQKKVEQGNKNLERSQKAVSESGISFSRVLGSVGDRLGQLGGSAGTAGNIISSVGSRLGNFSERLRESAGNVTGLGGTFLRLTGAAAGGAAALAAVVTIPLASFFTKASDGADLFSDKMAGIRQGLSNLGNFFSDFGRNISGAFSSLLEGDFAKFYDFLTRDVKIDLDFGVKEAEALNKATRELEDRVTEILRINKLNEKTISGAREIISREVKTLEDARKQREAINLFEQKSIENASNEVRIAKDNLAIVRERIRLDNDGISSEDKRAIVDAQNRVTDAEIRQDLEQKAINRLKKQNDAFKAAIEKDIQEVNQLADQLELKSLKEFQLGLEIPKIETEREKIAFLQQIVTLKDELNAQLSQLQDRAIDTLGLEKGQDLINGILESVQQLNGYLQTTIDEISKIDTSIKPLTPTRDIRQSVIDTAGQIQITPPEVEIKKDSEKELQELRNLTNETINSFKQIQDAFIQAEINKTDALIAEQQRRVDETREIAEKGNAEQLQLEQERLNNLIAERAAAVEKQDALNKAQAVSQAALNVVQLIGAIVGEAGKTSVYSAIAGGIALVATIAGLVSQIKGFKHGTDEMKGPGTGTSDSIIARVSKGEMIVPDKEASMLRSMNVTRFDLPKYVKLGKMFEKNVNTTKILTEYRTNNTSIDSALMKDYISAVKENTQNMRQQKITFAFDGESYKIRQQDSKFYEAMRSRILR